MELDVPVLGQQSSDRGGHVLLPLGGLVPGGELGSVHVQGADLVHLAAVR